MSDETNKKFADMKRYFFDMKTSVSFVEFLTTIAKTYAPQKKGENSFSYEVVAEPEKVVFDYPRTIQPLKKFFLPPVETLLSYNLNSHAHQEPEIDNEKKIFFGIHSYEMQGVLRLDYSFTKGHPEANYLNRRENSLFIGISFKPDKYHFSKSVGIEIERMEGFCLFFEPVENGFLVFVVTDDGNELLQKFGKGKEISGQIDIIPKNFESKIKYHYNRLPQIFDYVYNSPVWDKVAEKCLGCGTCNLLCSTCYCFDVRDEINLDAESGERQRFWDGCMLNSFAIVAGGENFRDKLNSRTRHRLYRKFKYITDQTGDLFCVGCGRCSKFCPAEINIVDIINDLIEDYAHQQKQVI